MLSGYGVDPWQLFAKELFRAPLLCSIDTPQTRLNTVFIQVLVNLQETTRGVLFRVRLYFFVRIQGQKNCHY